MKAIILTRVSTKMQEEGLSLIAQNNRLQDYAERKGLEIIKTFEIVESSTHGERKPLLPIRLTEFKEALKKAFFLMN